MSEFEVMRKAKVLVLSPIPHDPVSSWRCMGPLSAMGDVEVKALPFQSSLMENWYHLMAADIVLAHRPFQPVHFAWMEAARKMGKRIWLDIDDDLFNVQGSNPVTHTYNNPVVQETTRKCLQLADIVSVTTQHLADTYKPYAKKLVIVPNAWDKRLQTEFPKFSIKNNIFWRGSDSHQEDILTHIEGFRKAGKELQQTWKWNFIGWNAWTLKDVLPNHTFHGGLPFYDFYRHYGQLSPDIVVVPLKDDTFNRCKSNIAWLESTLAGAAVVAPDWPEWRKPGVETFSTPEEMAEKILKLTKDKSLILKNRELSLEYIRNNLTLEQINELRYAIIEELLNAKNSSN